MSQAASSADDRRNVVDISAACPQATHLLALLGEPIDQAYLKAFVQRYGEEWLQRIVDPNRSVRQFRATLQTVLQRDYWELLELLLLEHWLSSQPRNVGRFLGKDSAFDRTLIRLRASIALALYSRAKSVNWQEPLTFSRALRVAEFYLKNVLEHKELLKPKAVREYEGRLGVAMVLQARYGDLGVDAVYAMAHHLRASIEAGNDSVDAYVYLAEALLRQHDSTGDPQALSELVKLRESARLESPSESLDSHLAEAWFRLSQHASTLKGRSAFRDNADGLARGLLRSRDPIVQCRAAIIIALLQIESSREGGGSQILLRGLRTPFGLKRQVRVWQKSDRKLTVRILRAITEQLGSSPKLVAKTPIHRSLKASASSQLAGLLIGQSWTDERLRYLRAAVVLRSEATGARALQDPESRLENALDRFELFRLTRQRFLLVSAIQDTLSLIDFDQAWPTPLLVLARELEALGEPLPMQVAYELRKTELGSARIALNHVLVGNVSEIYSLAASRALDSREVDRKHLGGRSGVYLAEDYSGIISETFVFKPTTVTLADRESIRVAKLTPRIKQLGAEQRFSVPETLARSELPTDDVLCRQGYDVLVARQFHFGTILPDFLAGADLARRTSVLDQVLRFLAVIHSCESQEGEVGKGMRRELWKKEFGRWLKSGMQLSNASEIFEQWWSLFGTGVPALARRDAHPLNWIITPGDNVVAVDFEACGWRPAGYEVAQLLDDRPLLPVDEAGWKARLFLLRQYRRAMRKHGYQIDPEQLVRAWEASTVARAVGALTSPSSDRNLREHGEALLAWLAEHSNSPQVRAVAGELRRGWGVRRGALTLQTNSRLITDATRRHLSRAMAYELRHGEDVMLDRGGWAYLASVSDALNRAGLRTDKAEVLAVAGAIDEPRFEVDRNRVRARYGHTRDVEISYRSVSARPTLYHGTATRNLQAIFIEGQGLRAMGRHWVHLSSDPVQALRTAERHGPGVLLAVEPTEESVRIFEAGGTVFLADSVPARALRIVSPAELFLTASPGGAAVVADVGIAATPTPARADPDVSGTVTLS